MYEQLLKYRDLMTIIGVSRRTAYELLHSECFPSIRINDRYYVKQSSFEKWLSEQEGTYFRTKQTST